MPKTMQQTICCLTALTDSSSKTDGIASDMWITSSLWHRFSTWSKLQKTIFSDKRRCKAVLYITYYKHYGHSNLPMQQSIPFSKVPYILLNVITICQLFLSLLALLPLPRSQRVCSSAGANAMLSHIVQHLLWMTLVNQFQQALVA